MKKSSHFCLLLVQKVILRFSVILLFTSRALEGWTRAGSSYIPEPAEGESGYLCHRVFLSSLLGTDILPSRGCTRLHVHTDIWLHNQHQTGLSRTLSTEEGVFIKLQKKCPMLWELHIL